jgi:hypothetical protein
MPLRTLAVAVTFAAHVSCANGGTAALPPLSDDEFWRLSTTVSEPEGSFEHADNLVSNETLFAQVSEALRVRGGAYIGVGPEQNFSYIARVRPALAFIIDIREENRSLHLMYKALFEMSDDRAEFLARLFSRPRPPGLYTTTSVHDLFAAFEQAIPSAKLHEETRRLVRHRLLEVQRFALSFRELQSIDYALKAFYADGPDIRYGRSVPVGEARPTYWQLMTATDLRGTARSYLATEDAFRYVQDLHARNRIVPIVGDFAGPHAIRRVGDYIRQQGTVVSAFYGSNVEVYLTRDRTRAFCASLATLPYHDTTVFIASKKLQTLRSKLDDCVRVPPSLRWP